MTDSVEPADLVRALEVDLSRTFTVSVDGSDWLLVHRRTGRSVRMSLSAADLADYVADLEDSAFETLGVEPKWKSAVAMLGVFVAENEYKIEDSSRERIVFNGVQLDVVRNPPPGKA